MTDAVGNTLNLNTADFVALGFPTELTVESVAQEEEDQTRDYVVLATNSAWLKDSSKILSGNVGVQDISAGPLLDADAEFSIGKDVTTPANAELKANRIKIGKRSVISSDVFYNELTNSGIITGSQNTPLDLPLFSSLPPFESSEPGTEDVKVPSNGFLTLDAGNYRDLTVKTSGTILFTGGIYNIRSLHAYSRSKILFAAPTEVRIKDKLDTDRKVFVGQNPGSGIDASDVVFYVAGINGNSGNLRATPKAAQLGKENTVSANLYVLNGTLWIGDRTKATGSFLAKDVLVGKGVQLVLDSYF